MASPLFDVVGEGPPVEDRGISRGAAWGDYDGDGDPDLFVTRPAYEGPAQHNVLYRNDGEGRFSRVSLDHPPPAGWEGAAWIDVEGDGDLDLHVVGREGAGSIFYENHGGELVRRGDDPFGGAVHSASMACWADADADGRLDVFVVGYGEGRNAFFRSAGAWSFEPVPLSELARGGGSSRACTWADLEGDGLPELVVANARRPDLLLRNRGGADLSADTTTGLQADTAYGYGLSSADANGDGRVDVFVANFDAGNSLYLGSGDGSLERMELGGSLQSAASKGHAWGDYDLDGHQDLFLGSGTYRPDMLNRVYLAGDGGRFALVQEGDFAAHADTSAAVANADYDLDGDLDVFVANWGSPANRNRLYRNTTTVGDWLKIRLRGVESNRMGVGARASVLVSHEGGERWLHRWLSAATGYAGQNEPVLHFGLGHPGRVDSLIVAWPSGTVDHFGELPARATIVIREGSRTPEIR